MVNTSKDISYIFKREGFNNNLKCIYFEAKGNKCLTIEYKNVCVSKLTFNFHLPVINFHFM